MSLLQTHALARGHPWVECFDDSANTTSQAKLWVFVGLCGSGFRLVLTKHPHSPSKLTSGQAPSLCHLFKQKVTAHPPVCFHPNPSGACHSSLTQLCSYNLRFIGHSQYRPTHDPDPNRNQNHQPSSCHVQPICTSGGFCIFSLNNGEPLRGECPASAQL